MFSHRSIVAAIVTSLLALPLVAARVQEPGAAPNKVTINVQFPDGHRTTIAVKEGQPATMESENDGRVFSLSAEVQDLETGAVSLRFAEVTRMPSGEKVDTFVRELALDTKHVSRFRSLEPGDGAVPTEARVTGYDAPFAFSVVGLNLPKAASNRACTDGSGAALGRPLLPETNNPCSRCCISCDGWRFCGCAVEACGTSCCCTACC